MASALRFDRLSCGIPTCIQTSVESKLVSISVWINAGSSRDPVGKGGLAHLCEHLLLRPLMCTDTRAQQIQLKTGALVNAHTDPEWVVISAQAPAEQSGPLTKLLSALVREPYSKPEGIEAEKRVILQELRDGAADSAELLAEVFLESAFTATPYVHPVGGTPATLNAIQAQDVQRYYARSLTASRMLITAYGVTNAQDLADSLDRAFADSRKTSLPSGFQTSGPAREVSPPPSYRPVRIFKETQSTGPISGCVLLAGLASVPRGTEEYWTALAFEVLMADGPESLLSRWMRHEAHRLYGALSMTEAYASWGYQYFLMHISKDQVDQAVDHLGQRWLALSDAVTNERVKTLRNRFATRALSSLARMQDRMALMRDIALHESRTSETLDDGFEAIVLRNVGELSFDKLSSYIRRYAEWDRVSLVCAPI